MKEITYNDALQHVTECLLKRFSDPTDRDDLPALRGLLNDVLNRLSRQGDYEELKARVDNLEVLRTMIESNSGRKIRSI